MLKQLALFADLPLCLPFLRDRTPRTVGSKLTTSTCRSDGIELLEAEGWTFLGEGCFSCAYLSPDGERVVKFGSGRGQMVTLRTAQEHPDNPHLPAVYGLVELGDDEFIVETEPLEHFEDYDPDGYSDTGNADYYDWRRTYHPTLGSPRHAPDGPMKDAILALIDARERLGGGWDCHDGNIMVRPETGELVLNDLLA